jgi:SAM-dependent methyltransferase
MADAFGRMVEDRYHDRLVERPVYRRDDGQVSEAHLEGYFAPYPEWSELDRRTVEHVSGSVLDAGCGVGRTALWAQREGHEVVGVDRSPGAVWVARDRGLDRVAVADLTDLGVRARFDTLLVLGKQLGLGRSGTDLRENLLELARVTEPGGRLIADLNDPTHPDARVGSDYLEDHAVGEGLAYRRFRIEYDGLVGPWTDLLMASERALRAVVPRSTWEVEEVLRDGDVLAVVLRRDSNRRWK